MGQTRWKAVRKQDANGRNMESGRQQHTSILNWFTTTFKNQHATDDENGKQHSHISLEAVWAVKWWHNCVFAFLHSITEVNCFLTESYFTGWKCESMMDFRKTLAYQLIENGSL